MNQFSPGRFTLLPVVVKNLLIINVIFFLATFALERMGIDLRDILGLHYFSSEKFKPFQLVTYMFMHGSLGHIFFNLFAIWMFGYAIENFWGPTRFLIYYLITGFGAAIIHYAIFYFQVQPIMTMVDQFMQNPNHESLHLFLGSENFRIVSYEMQDLYSAFKGQYNQVINVDSGKALDLAIDFMQDYRIEYLNAPVIVGASGALFGILLAFGMMFPNSLIYLYFAIPVKAKYLVIGYGLIEFISGVSNRPGDNVAHWAHLGGMVFGFILLKYWKVRPLN